jgi:hypothetical protein
VKAKINRHLAAVALLLLCTVSAAGDSFTLTSGGPAVTFQFIATPLSTATATFSLNGNLLTLTLANTSSVGNVKLFDLSFNTSPTVNVAIQSTTPLVEDYAIFDRGPVTGTPESFNRFELRVSSTPSSNCPGTGNLLCSGQSGTFVFLLTMQDGSPFSGPLTIDATVARIGSVDGFGESVTVPGTVVPEPASLVLLGTGLLGAAGLLRRRWAKD